LVTIIEKISFQECKGQFPPKYHIHKTKVGLLAKQDQQLYQLAELFYDEVDKFELSLMK
jgi:hypothetical protein